MTQRRLASLATALVLIGAALPASVGASARPPEARAVGRSAEAVGSGGVAINGAAAAVASDVVTVAVPSPANSYGILRISNNGGVSWLQRAWTTAFTWSLVDPAAGGVDVDGTKTVTVQGGDGLGAWAPLGAASILLDRTGPSVGTADIGSDDRPVLFGYLAATDVGVGLERVDVSLDGVHWRPFSPDPFTFYPDWILDVREGTIGGSWEPGERLVHMRAVDKLGNITVADPVSKTLSNMRMGDDPPARFEFPLPAVPGQTYTIKPVFDTGFRVAAGDFCQWRLIWGSADVRLEAGYDVTYGEVMTSVSPVNGVCQPWTFTLPYTPPLEYSWTLSINDGPSSSRYSTSALAGSFRATPGGTSRAITTSNIPLYYLLPDRDYVGTTGIVTYRLYAVGGAASASGWWSCFPADRTPSTAQTDQYGGSTFACSVTTTEPWTAFWAREAGGRVWRAGYDPIGDRSRPTVTAVRATVAPAAWLTTTTSARVTWAGRDAGSGVYRYTLQQSRNGGSWTKVALPSRLATSLNRSLVLGSTYRFRVRATDRAGNVGAWRYSASFRPTGYDDGTSLATWTSGWTRVTLAGAVGGSARKTTSSGASTTFRFSGLAVGILAPRGPNLGFAQVYVDGVLAATVDLRATTASAPRVVWSKSWSSAASHVVKVRALGTVGHPGVVVDAFAVLR